MPEIIIMGLSGDSKVLPMTATKTEIVDAILETPRTQVCTECDVVMVEDWNLAPIESDKVITEDTDKNGNVYLIERDTERVYAEDVYLCDECYDHWCTKNDIQPLEGE